ncbi:SIR2 family protein [Aeromonas veronii]
MTLECDKTFLELVSEYHQKTEKFCFFVGAGLSQPLFPSWKNLLKTFVEEAKKGNLAFDDSELLSYIEHGQNYLDIAEACIDSMGENRYRDIMELTFDKDFSDEEIPVAYKALMNLSPKTIITTNYDRIPDRAGNGRYRTHTNKNAAEAARNVANGKNIVFKIHGDITEQSSIVIKTSDYQRIINSNESTKNFISSLLSTKQMIFIGFSLSDPHIDILLERIKTINNGIPLSHYVLLNEPSQFKISSFERKYGVKVIQYKPSDDSHPEVIEFLRALEHDVSTISVTPKKSVNIIKKEHLITHLSEVIPENFIDTEYTVFCRNSELYVSFTSAGETKGEVQREILSLIKLMDFECNIINRIIICVTGKTKPLINCDDSQPLLINASLSFSDANRFALKKISTSTVWKLIDFYTSPSLSNIFEQKTFIGFPLSIGITGEKQ